jgi:uncharacterized membrane protein YfcA
MFLPWPVFLLVAFALTAGYFFSGHVNWKDVVAVVMFCFSIFPFGCLGGWIGSMIAHRYKSNPFDHNRLIKSSPA